MHSNSISVGHTKMCKYPIEIGPNNLQFIRQMKLGKAPTYLSEQLGYVRDVQSYHLRNTEDFSFQWRQHHPCTGHFFSKDYLNS